MSHTVTKDYKGDVISVFVGILRSAAKQSRYMTIKVSICWVLSSYTYVNNSGIGCAQLRVDPASAENIALCEAAHDLHYSKHLGFFSADPDRIT